MAGGQDFTANLSLPYLISNQAQKHVTLNESLRAIDGLVQASILSRLEADPPISPSEGDRYLVATSATGDWAGQEGNLALCTGLDQCAGDRHLAIVAHRICHKPEVRLPHTQHIHNGFAGYANLFANNALTGVNAVG